ncbi:hypothetical protein MHU86_23750 [Fragilaria crotonensis]|nr:hypothetical protein MHU86_23750 [Fragilaria crotonensis]
MYEAMLQVVVADGDASPFYEPLTPSYRQQYLEWITQWRTLLADVVGDTSSGDGERMRMSNPKYVLREWMLVKAYSDAANGNDDELHDLYALIQNPYDEGTLEQQKYYRRTPEEAFMTAGTAFMSCSS